MDQMRIGRFIAERRRAQALTQRELAERLAISDKTVSKWERGKGLPEVSLMQPLCAALGITVNDLLSGEIVADGCYRQRAEANLMDLMRKAEENRRRMAAAVACGAVTVVAVGALVVIAAAIAMPTAARIALLVLAAAVAVCGVGAAAVMEVSVGAFECPRCHALFVPTMREYVRGDHGLRRRRLTCPQCGARSLCRHRVTK